MNSKKKEKKENLKKLLKLTIVNKNNILKRIQHNYDYYSCVYRGDSDLIRCCDGEEAP